MKNVERIWLKSSIPVISHKRVLQIRPIKAYRDKCMKFIEPFKDRRNDEKSKAKIRSFREDSSCKLISQLASVYWTVTERSISRFNEGTIVSTGSVHISRNVYEHSKPEDHSTTHQHGGMSLEKLREASRKRNS